MNCNCNDISTTLPSGPQGPTGDTGLRGGYGGFSSDWVFNETIGGAPGNRKLTFDSNTSNAVTQINVSETNTSSQDLTNFIDSLSNNSRFGYIRFFDITDSTKFWYGELTNVTPVGTYWELVVTYIASSDAAVPNIFVEDTDVVLTFSPSAETTPSVINNDVTETSTNSTIYDNLLSMTIPANKMANDGDVFEITTSFLEETTSGLRPFDCWAKINIGGVTSHTIVSDFILPTSMHYLMISVKASRESSTSLFLEFTSSYSNLHGIEMASYHFIERGFAVADLSTTPLVIQVLGKVEYAVKVIKQEQLLVTYYNI